MSVRSPSSIPSSPAGELARRVGADVAYAPDADLSGMDFDLAIEASGSAGALDQALTSVVFGGSVVVCSWYGTKPVPLLLGGPFHRRRLRIVSSQVGTIDAALQPRWTHARRLALCLRAASAAPAGTAHQPSHAVRTGRRGIPSCRRTSRSYRSSCADLRCAGHVAHVSEEHAGHVVPGWPLHRAFPRRRAQLFAQARIVGESQQCHSQAVHVARLDE